MSAELPRLASSATGLERALLASAASDAPSAAAKLKAAAALGLESAAPAGAAAAVKVGLAGKLLATAAVGTLVAVGGLWWAGSTPEPSSLVEQGAGTAAPSSEAAGLGAVGSEVAKTEAARPTETGAEGLGSAAAADEPAEARASEAAPVAPGLGERTSKADRASGEERALRAPTPSLLPRGAGQAAPAPAPKSERVAAVPAPTPSETLEPAPAPVPTAQRTLAAEIALLDRARTHAQKSEAKEALELLGEYRARFPSGELLPEAEALRIELLLKRGDRAEALDLAGRFFRAYPSNPHTARLRRLIEVTAP